MGKYMSRVVKGNPQKSGRGLRADVIENMD